MDIDITVIEQQINEFAARRVTTNDIFNYRSYMTKVSGGSELVMPMGAGGEAPIQDNGRFGEMI